MLRSLLHLGILSGGNPPVGGCPWKRVNPTARLTEPAPATKITTATLKTPKWSHATGEAVVPSCWRATRYVMLDSKTAAGGVMRGRKEIGERATAAWRLSSRWWLVTTFLGLGLTATFASLWLWGDVKVPGSSEKPYLVRELLKDGADIALKLGAVIAGMLAIYRYWYHRYEPLVYFVSCGLASTSVPSARPVR